jgi:hypothetical protein
VTSDPNADISVWSVPNYEIVRELDSANEALECLQVGSQGQVAYLRTFDTGTLQMTSEIQGPVKNPIGVKLSPEEDWIYMLGRDGALVRMPCGSLP